MKKIILIASMFLLANTVFAQQYCYVGEDCSITGINAIMHMSKGKPPAKLPIGNFTCKLISAEEDVAVEIWPRSMNFEIVGGHFKLDTHNPVKKIQITSSDPAMAYLGAFDVLIDKITHKNIMVNCSQDA